MQIIRIYRLPKHGGGLVHQFKPFHKTADQMKQLEDQYPEGKEYLWLR